MVSHALLDVPFGRGDDALMRRAGVLAVVALLGCGGVVRDLDASTDGAADAAPDDDGGPADGAADASCVEAGGYCQSTSQLQCMGGGVPAPGYGCASGDGCCLPFTPPQCNGLPCPIDGVCLRDAADAGAGLRCAQGDGAAPTCGQITCGQGCTCASLSDCQCP